LQSKCISNVSETEKEITITILQEKKM